MEPLGPTKPKENKITPLDNEYSFEDLDKVKPIKIETTDPKNEKLNEDVVEKIKKDPLPTVESGLGEVAKEIATLKPKVITNPVDVAIKYLKVNETEEEGVKAIKGFYESALTSPNSAFGDKTITDKQLATEKAWCAAFTNYVLKEAGYDTSKTFKDQYSKVRALEYKKLGKSIYGNDVSDLSKAQNGDIVVLKTGSNYHVGFYAGKDPKDENKVLILGGNQSEDGEDGVSVNIKPFDKTMIQGVNRIENVSALKSDTLKKINKNIIYTGTTGTL